MEEQELDLLLNRTTKLVLRGYPGRSVVLEIRRAVNSSKHGHGWSIESQAFLDDAHVQAIREYVTLLANSANFCKRLQTATETREKTGCEKTSKKGNEITPRL